MAFGKNKPTTHMEETQSIEGEQTQDQASNEDFINLDTETQ